MIRLVSDPKELTVITCVCVDGYSYASLNTLPDYFKNCFDQGQTCHNFNITIKDLQYILMGKPRDLTSLKMCDMLSIDGFWPIIKIDKDNWEFLYEFGMKFSDEGNPFIDLCHSECNLECGGLSFLPDDVVEYVYRDLSELSSFEVFYVTKNETYVKNTKKEPFYLMGCYTLPSEYMRFVIRKMSHMKAQEIKFVVNEILAYL